jgi:two-component system OmpR family response regulator
MRVLVVDDEIALGEVMITALTRAGLDAVYVSNGGEAVRSVTTRGADVIVVDMHMPGMDGLEFIQRVRRLRPRARILGISGGDKGGDKMMLKMSGRLGAHAVLPKPFKPSDLIAKVKELGAAAEERV